MKSGHRKWQLAAIVMLLPLVIGLFFNQQAKVADWWSVLPPLMAIALAFITGNLFVSLAFAILLGTVFVSQDQIIMASGSAKVLLSMSGGIGQMLGHFWSAISSFTNLQILGFVFFILSLVHVMTLAGGLHAMVERLRKYIVGPRTAQLMTSILGFFIFIDDYANTMIVGSTMKGISDKYKISREKLAFLVDATSAPVAGIALVSTWIGYEVGLFSEMAEKFAWHRDGYSIFLDAVSYRFYCFFMLFFVFANSISGADFGPMKNTMPVANPAVDDAIEHKPLICSVLPLGLLLFLVFSLMWLDGGGWGLNPLSLSDWRTVLTASQNGISILLISAFIAWVAANLTAHYYAKLNIEKLLSAFKEGLRSAVLPAAILVLAWSLKAVCDDLKTGEYLVTILGSKVGTVWLPMAIFVVAALTAFSTGTSWGTMAILIPTVTPLAVQIAGGEYGSFVALCLAAILDGAIMGDHCSPVSDTTIMSSISTDCDLIAHVKTQLPYSLIVGVLALVFGYLPAALGVGVGVSYFASAALIGILFYYLQRRN